VSNDESGKPGESSAAARQAAVVAAAIGGAALGTTLLPFPIIGTLVGGLIGAFVGASTKSNPTAAIPPKVASPADDETAERKAG